MVSFIIVVYAHCVQLLPLWRKDYRSFHNCLQKECQFVFSCYLFISFVILIILYLFAQYFEPLVTYHRFISFMLYVFGFVWFVLSLVKKYYLRQFSLVCFFPIKNSKLRHFLIFGYFFLNSLPGHM